MLRNLSKTSHGVSKYLNLDGNCEIVISATRTGSMKVTAHLMPDMVYDDELTASFEAGSSDCEAFASQLIEFSRYFIGSSGAKQ